MKLADISALLFSRKDQPRIWLFAFAALPLALFGLMGAEYGALPFYLAGAAAPLVQLVFPTLFVWVAVTTLYFGLASGVLVGLASDLVAISRGNPPSILVDANDSFFFLLLGGYILAVTIGLFLSFPRSKQGNENVA